MGVVVRLIPPILALAVLAAHFFRRAPMPTVKFMFIGIALVLMLILLIPNRWTVKPVQLVILLGAWEWIATMLESLAERQAAGAPYLRMCLILVGVSIFTAWAGLLPSRGRLRHYYARTSPSEAPDNG